MTVTATVGTCSPVLTRAEAPKRKKKVTEPMKFSKRGADCLTPLSVGDIVTVHPELEVNQRPMCGRDPRAVGGMVSMAGSEITIDTTIKDYCYISSGYEWNREWLILSSGRSYKAIPKLKNKTKIITSLTPEVQEFLAAWINREDRQRNVDSSHPSTGPVPKSAKVHKKYRGGRAIDRTVYVHPKIYIVINHMLAAFISRWRGWYGGRPCVALMGEKDGVVSALYPLHGTSEYPLSACGAMPGVEPDDIAKGCTTLAISEYKIAGMLRLGAIENSVSGGGELSWINELSATLKGYVMSVGPEGVTVATATSDYETRCMKYKVCAIRPLEKGTHIEDTSIESNK